MDLYQNKIPKSQRLYLKIFRKCVTKKSQKNKNLKCDTKLRKDR